MIAVLTATTLAPLMACAPIVFEDKSALTIVGDPPPPPPKPEPVVEKPKRVEVKDDRIIIREVIQFEFDKATILPASDSLLDEIAKTIRDNPHIKKISIEGHASAEGSDKHNLKLSDERAKSVMKHLIETDGVPKEMLIAKGFGETRPLPNTNPEDEANRRVEFIITEQDVTMRKVAIDPETNQETVLEKKTVTESKPVTDVKPAAESKGN